MIHKYWEKVIKPIYQEIREKKKSKSDLAICLIWLGFLTVILYPVYIFRMAIG